MATKALKSLELHIQLSSSIINSIRQDVPRKYTGLIHIHVPGFRIHKYKEESDICWSFTVLIITCRRHYTSHQDVSVQVMYTELIISVALYFHVVYFL